MSGESADAVRQEPDKPSEKPIPHTPREEGEPPTPTHGYCITGKRSYLRRRDAKRALKRLQSLPRTTTRLTAVYRCPLCRRYHLTKQKPKRHAA